MKRLNPSRYLGAFTLVELLIVISIIAILAALIIPAAGAMKQRRTRAVIHAEVAKVASAIEAYKAKHGHYPPDNPCNVNVNPLYFELIGVRREANRFETLDGSAAITDAELNSVFGITNGKACVGGFVNASRGANSDDGAAALTYLKDIKTGQFGVIQDQVRILTSSQPWEPSATPAVHPIPSMPGMNPIRYNLSNPVHNPKSFDLWVDVMIGGRTNRIGNWSESHQFVATPQP